jgi:hypothetical protein
MSKVMLKLAFCFAGAIIVAIAGHGVSGENSIPKTVRSCLASAGYQSDTKIAPHFLFGDFYGDGKRAEAILISKDGKRGVLICDSYGGRRQSLGAGLPFNGMSNLNFSSWKLYPRGKVDQGVGVGPPPVLRGDAIWIEWEESASAIVYWNGHEFVWYQQGD